VKYEQLEQEVARQQYKPVRNLSRAWERFQPLGEATEVVLGRIQHFADTKRISLSALECMETRWAIRNGGAVWLAWAATAQLNGSRVVTAVKSRELGSGQRTAEPGSTFVEPTVFGNPLAQAWFLFEGETDAARGLELVTGKAAVMVLPAGALTFRPEWAKVIPRGATVYCCHDADEAGDKGAAKVARMLGGGAVRLRPPVEGGDWCDWPGDREQFAELVVASARTIASLEVVSALDLCERPDPEHGGELIGPLVVEGARTIVLGHTGAGKSTLISRLGGAIISGSGFLDWTGAGGIRILLIDLEQSEADAKRMLREAGLERSEAIGIALVPDGLELDSDDAQLAMVEHAIVDGGYGVVVFDPYYKAHRAEDSNAERQIDDLMRRLDGLRAQHGFALVLGAHPRKPPVGVQPALTVHDLAGSGAAVRGAEIIVAIERVSDGYSRLRFLKDRSGRLPVGDAWGLLFDRESGYRRDPGRSKTRRRSSTSTTSTDSRGGLSDEAQRARDRPFLHGRGRTFGSCSARPVRVVGLEQLLSALDRRMIGRDHLAVADEVVDALDLAGKGRERDQAFARGRHQRTSR
jgi:energy-coupling factor transporter ATP-binding protein EcfA2